MKRDPILAAADWQVLADFLPSLRIADALRNRLARGLEQLIADAIRQERAQTVVFRPTPTQARGG